jgi:uncharacterized phage-associated protein
MYDCFDIAKFFVELARKEGRGIDPMKLLKLTYIAHGWYLGDKGKPLFHNQVQAWRYGSVIPDLYYAIKIFGKNNVDPFLFKMYSDKKIKEEDEKFLKMIWDSYKNFSGLELSAKTHEEGSPWQIVYDGSHDVIIENSLIEDYYKHKLMANINE